MSRIETSRRPARSSATAISVPSCEIAPPMVLPACMMRLTIRGSERSTLVRPPSRPKTIGVALVAAKRPPRRAKVAKPSTRRRCVRSVVSTISTEPLARSTIEPEIAGAAQLAARHAPPEQTQPAGKQRQTRPQ